MPWCFCCCSDLEKIRQIVVADITPPDRDLSDGCIDIIKGCLTVDVEKRYTIDQLRVHPWTCEGYDGPPQCCVPETKPVAKVSEPLLDQLVFLGILDGSTEARERARKQIEGNEKTQVVYAYHTLLQKPQLLVSASFLPRDKIKRAVSAHREAQNKSVVAGAATSPLATNTSTDTAAEAGDDESESATEAVDEAAAAAQRCAVRNQQKEPAAERAGRPQQSARFD